MRKHIAMIFRIVISPLFVVFIGAGLLIKLLNMTYYFVKHGGEFLTYEKDDRVMIGEIYQTIKLNHKSQPNEKR